MSLFNVVRGARSGLSSLSRPSIALRLDSRALPTRPGFSSMPSLKNMQLERPRFTQTVGRTATNSLQKSLFHSSAASRIWFQTASTASAAIAGGVGAAAAAGVVGRKKRRRLLKLLLFLVALGILDAAYLSTQTESDECWQLLFLEHLPLRAMSHLWGWVHNFDLPIFMRAPLYYAWTWAFDCNLEEMRDPISSYRNLNQFFTRHLKPHVRPLGAAEMVSPVDGRVLVTGEVKGNTLVQRVKGASYEVEGLLGYKPEVKNPDNQLYYIVIYLWPGDYHRMHAPNDFVAKKRAHIAGELFPVSPYFAHYVPGLFCRNERIVLTGEWRHGFYSFVPVGAYNVGSIRLSLPGDTDLQTNGPGQFLRMPITPHAAAPPQPFSTHDAPKYTARRPLPPIHSEVAYAGADGNGLQLKKGDEVAVFELGSTVVMVFEAPKDFRFRVMNGERVKMGQNLGSLSN